MEYTDEQRKLIGQEAVGKTVESLEWDDVDRNWVITFTDETEFCFRFMAELV